MLASTVSSHSPCEIDGNDFTVSNTRLMGQNLKSLFNFNIKGYLEHLASNGERI